MDSYIAELLTILDSLITGVANTGSHEVVDKDNVNTENSQMTSIGAIFSYTYHTKQLNPWQNSSSSRVVNYNQLSACPWEMEEFKDHPSTRGCLTSLRNKPQQKQPGQFSAPITA